MARRPISLADRLRALASLVPGDNWTKAALLDMMRSHESPGNVRRAAHRAAGPQARTQPAASPDWLLRGDREAAEPPAAAPKPTSSVLPNATRVTPLGRRPISAPSPLASSGLAALGSVPERQPLPIIDFGKTRAVLAALSATPAPGGAVDTSAVLDCISRGLPLDRLSRLTVWSVRRGLQLLIDRSAAMTPLRYDVESVGSRLELILGDRLQRLYFDSCPSRGVGAGERSGWKPWTAPAAGVPVVMLTDLGCAGPRSNPEWASPEEWARFADRAGDAGTTLLALVPYPARRVPPALAQRVTVAPWREDLGAARVRRILRDARAKR
jgi:hypothetical protein